MANYKSKGRYNSKKNQNKRKINRALRAKGKGSVSRAWGMAKYEARKGNIGMAVSLGNIARKKAAYARRKKR